MVVQKAVIHWFDQEPTRMLAMGAWNRSEVIAMRDTNVVVGVDLEILRGAREAKEYVRKPKGPWQRSPMERDVRVELCELHKRVQHVFVNLYSEIGPPKYSQFTFRPTITRGEPHKDVEKGTVITAFINLDDEDRQWMIAGEKVNFPPRCMWIFQAEKIEHQVIYGRLCAQLNWHLM